VERTNAESLLAGQSRICSQVADQPLGSYSKLAFLVSRESIWPLRKEKVVELMKDLPYQLHNPNWTRGSLEHGRDG